MKKKKKVNSYKTNSLIFLFVLVVFIIFPRIFFFYRQSYEVLIIIAWVIVAGVFIYLIDRAKFSGGKTKKKSKKT